MHPSASELEPIEHASRDELAALQLERLRQTLQRAYDYVPFYRKQFESYAVHPGDLEQLSDLARFPFTTKSDLRAHYPFGMLAVPRKMLARIHASSGTTGKPTVVGYTTRDLEVWARLVARSMRAAGVQPGDMVHVAYGYGLFTGGLGAHYGAEALGCTVIPMSGGQTERQVRLIRDLRPDAIMVTPSYMLAIADEFDRQGVNPRNTSLRVGIHGAEPWTESMRKAIEERFDMHAVDIYGLSEVMGPGVASECVDTKDGLHVWEDHFYPEIIDPVTGAVLPDGQVGELVFTTLTKEAQLLVRYRTRDLTALLPGTARTMRRMMRISGRSDDMLIIRGVNVFPTQIEEILLDDARLTAHYVLEVRRAGHLDDLTVVAEMRAGVLGDATDRDAASTGLAARIKDLVGVTSIVKLVPPDTIERSLGKAKRVLDFRQPE
ncbi:MAG: phenylacetate--CoA ligase PaaK [bacterium]